MESQQGFAVFYRDKTEGEEKDETKLVGIFLDPKEAETVAYRFRKMKPQGQRAISVRRVALEKEDEVLDLSQVFDTSDIFLEDDPPRNETMDLDPESTNN